MQYISMKEVKNSEFKETVIGNYKVSKKGNIKNLQPNKNEFNFETTTVWSYEKRGKWATHKSDYRGNWAPQIARNLILRYTKERETVLDCMVGGGTTLIECKLTGRNGIGIDINEDAIMITRDRLHFETIDNSLPKTTQRTFIGDARNLNLIEDESIDLIATHPPYANIILYTEKGNGDDLSNIKDIEKYVAEIGKISKECFRVLKQNKYCAILIGDTRRNKHFVPIAYRVMNEFLKSGFVLKEDIIKRQWNCKSTGFWTNKSLKDNFLLIMHEHIFVFRKPKKDEDLGKFEESMKI